jgi:hypothetical protein
MRRNVLTLAIVFALGTGLMTACDKPRPTTPKTDVPPISRAPSTLPSGAPPAATAQTKDSANPPVQGQVDTKQSEQNRDFQQPGEQTGPGTNKPAGG